MNQKTFNCIWLDKTLITLMMFNGRVLHYMVKLLAHNIHSTTLKAPLIYILTLSLLGSSWNHWIPRCLVHISYVLLDVEGWTLNVSLHCVLEDYKTCDIRTLLKVKQRKYVSIPWIYNSLRANRAYPWGN